MYGWATQLCDVREPKFAYYDKGWLMATDRHRLHMQWAAGLGPTGYYDPTTMTHLPDCPYGPMDYMRLLRTPNLPCLRLTLADFKSVTDIDMHYADMGFNAGYIRDAFVYQTFMYGPDKLNYRDQLILVGNDRIAVIAQCII